MLAFRVLSGVAPVWVLAVCSVPMEFHSKLTHSAASELIVLSAWFLGGGYKSACGDRFCGWFTGAWSELAISSTNSRQPGLTPDFRLCSLGRTFSNFANILISVFMSVPANYSAEISCICRGNRLICFTFFSPWIGVHWCCLSTNEPSDAHRLAGSLFVSCWLRLLVNPASSWGLQSMRGLVLLCLLLLQ